jgi:RNA polymerase sigma-70 factor (ECF subfamily)
MDDAQIFIGIKAGDKQAFDRLFYQLYPQVRFYIEKIIKDESESEDITQQSLLKFWEKGAGDFDSFSQVKSFIFTTAKNAAFNYLKRSKLQHTHHQHIVYLTTEAEETFSETLLYKMEMLQVLFEEIEHLPEQCKQTFKLVFLDNMPRPDVAAKLDISLNTVHAHCANAKKRLRQIFTEKELIVLLLLINACPN